MVKGIITAVCISEQKGTGKKKIEKGVLVQQHGLQNDAHAGNWHRQVSLLSADRVEEFKLRGAQVDDGAFGENILVAGIDLKTLPVGTLLHVGGARLRVTQIGKECHAHCAIYAQVGDCIMPREGIFAEVLAGGDICAGDEIYAEL